MSKHQTASNEIPQEISDEERRNHWFSFIVGIFIAVAIIAIFVVLSLSFPLLFH